MYLQYLHLFKHSWIPFTCHVILTFTYIFFDKTQYRTYIYIIFYNTFMVRLWLFLWDEYCSDAPIFPLLPQGGGNDSTAAQGRRRIRRVTKMVRFELLKLPEA